MKKLLISGMVLALLLSFNLVFANLEKDFDQYSHLGRELHVLDGNKQDVGIYIGRYIYSPKLEAEFSVSRTANGFDVEEARIYFSDENCQVAEGEIAYADWSTKWGLIYLYEGSEVYNDLGIGFLKVRNSLPEERRVYRLNSYDVCYDVGIVPDLIEMEVVGLPFAYPLEPAYIVEK